jgi:hypothetical protein
VKPLQASDARVVAGYQLIARLGAGGMGQVFLALSPAGDLVALKVVLPHLADQPEFRARFRREVMAARSVRGPYVAEVVDADPDGDLPWLATQYVAGPSLAYAVPQCGPLPPPTVTALGAAAVVALMAVERAGLVHRDLKPANVLLGTDGPRIIDFGIAKALDASHLTQTGMLVGTPGFMAPEQIEGAPLNAAADVFSLGAVLGFALTGTGPFGDGPPAALMGRVLYHEPDLSGVPGEWRETLRSCLAKQPVDRPSLTELLERLVPDGRPVAELVGPDWLPLSVRTYVDECTAVAKQHTAWFQTGRAGVPTAIPSLHPTPAGAPTGTATALRQRRRRVWPVLAAIAVTVAIAIPMAIAWLLPDSGGSRAAGEPEPSAAASLPASFAGVWAGRVHQSNVDSTYPVQLTLTGGEVGSMVGTVRYWSLPCSGELWLDRIGTNEIRVTERITDGVIYCVAETPLQLQLRDGDLWYNAYPDDPTQTRIEGTLVASTDRLPDRFARTWEGEVHQYDTNSDYSVVLTLEGGPVGSRVGLVEYPSLRCGGELRLDQIEGDIAWFTETITWQESALSCTTSGVIALTLTGDGQAEYDWYYWYESYDNELTLDEPMAEGQVS